MAQFAAIAVFVAVDGLHREGAGVALDDQRIGRPRAQSAFGCAAAARDFAYPVNACRLGERHALRYLPRP